MIGSCNWLAYLRISLSDIETIYRQSEGDGWDKWNETNPIQPHRKAKAIKLHISYDLLQILLRNTKYSFPRKK